MAKGLLARLLLLALLALGALAQTGTAPSTSTITVAGATYPICSSSPVDMTAGGYGWGYEKNPLCPKPEEPCSCVVVATPKPAANASATAPAAGATNATTTATNATASSTTSAAPAPSANTTTATPASDSTGPQVAFWRAEGAIQADVLVMDVGSLFFQDPDSSKAGVSNAKDCERFCALTPGCNAYSYCEGKDGCSKGCGDHVAANPNISPDKQHLLAIPSAVRSSTNRTLRIMALGPWGPTSKCQGPDARWPLGTCTLKKVNAGMDPKAPMGEPEGWVSGWVTDKIPFGVAVKSYGTCQSLGDAEERQECVDCAQLAAVYPVQALLRGHLSSTRADTCSQCFDNPAVSSKKCIACLVVSQDFTGAECPNPESPEYKDTVTAAAGPASADAIDRAIPGASPPQTDGGTSQTGQTGDIISLQAQMNMQGQAQGQADAAAQTAAHTKVSAGMGVATTDSQPSGQGSRGASMTAILVGVVLSAVLVAAAAAGFVFYRSRCGQGAAALHQPEAKDEERPSVPLFYGHVPSAVVNTNEPPKPKVDFTALEMTANPFAKGSPTREEAPAYCQGSPTFRGRSSPTAAAPWGASGSSAHSEQALSAPAAAPGQQQRRGMPAPEQPQCWDAKRSF